MEFYYDLVSPCSYLAHARMGHICEDADEDGAPETEDADCGDAVSGRRQRAFKAQLPSGCPA